MHTVTQQTFSECLRGAGPRAGCEELGAERRVLYGGEKPSNSSSVQRKQLRPSACILPSPTLCGWSICVLFLHLFHPSLGRGLSAPTAPAAISCLLSSASFDPFVKRLSEASELLATLAIFSAGLGLAS